MKKVVFSLLLTVTTLLSINAQNAKFPQNVSLKTLDGQTVQSSAIQNEGRPMIVSFWATWCKPCNLELNTIKEVYKEWQEETGVKLVAISIDDARSTNRVKPHAEGKKWPYEIYLDPNQDMKRAMNVGDIPHTFIIDGNGEVVYQHTTFVDGDEDELIEKVRELLK